MDQTTFKRKQRQFDRLEIIGVSDIAKLAGCPNSKVTLYMQRGILPDPVGQVGGRPVWLKAQVLPYLKALAPGKPLEPGQPLQQEQGQ